MKLTHGSEPPAGAPWDSPIDEAPLCFIDLEMTGLDPIHDRIIEVCLQRVVGGATEAELTTTVRPTDLQTWLPSVHGITPDAVKDSPTFEAIYPRVCELLQDAVLIAHGAPYDIAFLEASSQRASLPLALPCFLDTILLSRRVFGFDSHALAALAVSLGAPELPAHRAENDVVVLRHIFSRLTQALLPKNPRDLWHVEVGTKRSRPELAEALRQAALDKRPLCVRYRPSGKRPVQMRFMATKVEADLDPARVIGYLLPGRGARTLRIDRILALMPDQASPEDPKAKAAL